MTGKTVYNQVDYLNIIFNVLITHTHYPLHILSCLRCILSQLNSVMGRTDQPWSVIRFARVSVSGKGIAVLILHLEGDTLFHLKEIKRLEDWKRRKKWEKILWRGRKLWVQRTERILNPKQSQKMQTLKNTKPPPNTSIQHLIRTNFPYILTLNEMCLKKILFSYL